jgi:hypothetical protein
LLDGVGDAMGECEGLRIYREWVHCITRTHLTKRCGLSWEYRKT